jgi:hypothetical protein
VSKLEREEWDKTLELLDRILNVPAEEYVPAITEARDFIEKVRKILRK